VAKSVAVGERIDAVDVVCVLDLQMAYLRKIGAVGTVVEQNSAHPPEGVVD
jgi:hypothetical protein